MCPPVDGAGFFRVETLIYFWDGSVTIVQSGCNGGQWLGAGAHGTFMAVTRNQLSKLSSTPNVISSQTCTLTCTVGYGDSRRFHDTPQEIKPTLETFFSRHPNVIFGHSCGCTTAVRVIFDNFPCDQFTLA